MRTLCCVLLYVLLSAAAVAQAVYLSGDQPATSTTATGTPATAPLVVKPVKGGNDSAGSGTGGVGSSPSITAGDGGDGTASNGTGIGGTGGNFALGTGNGGASGSSAANGANGGDMSLNLGSAGSYSGTGTQGRNGTIFLSAPNNTNNTLGGTVSSPLLCGPTFGSICLYWTYNATNQIYNVLAWRDITGGSNQVTAGADDEGIRLGYRGAIRFTNSDLGGSFTNGGLTSANSTDGTLSICGAGLNVSDPCNTNDHGGNLKLTDLTSYGTVTFNDGSTAGNSGFAFNTSPTAPTPATADNSTKVATTAYVKNQAYATLSPTFTGTVTEPDGTTINSSGYTFAHALSLPAGSTAKRKVPETIALNWQLQPTSEAKLS